MKLGLAAIDAVCDRLGRPERRVPSVLVAGTNGKGSTAAALSAIARAGGIRAGLYTSPHLARAGERIRVEEEDLSDGELDRALETVFLAADAAPVIPVTYFEALTAAAFVSFSERDLDLSILEVGLGGRYDATNVAPPNLSVVTSIGLDHTAELGTTLAAIAREKAGIFRSDRPALIGPREEEPREALLQAARECGAVAHLAEEEVRVSGVATSPDGTRFSLVTPRGRYDLATPLPGRHQADNAALAVRAAELLSGAALRLGPGAISAGVAATRWPGRLEKMSLGGRTVLLDGCHNPQAAFALARFVEDAGLAGRARLVFGAMADKDVETMAATLFPLFASVHLVPAPSARAASVDELRRRTSGIRPGADSADSLEAALGALAAEPDPTPIIVAGSLYLIGAARSLLLSGRLEDK
ncbi:MAG: folylpolyglutamate synthase/dihydrofolate synthase family protein [Acidobacteriota bacterium]